MKKQMPEKQIQGLDQPKEELRKSVGIFGLFKKKPVTIISKKIQKQCEELKIPPPINHSVVPEVKLKKTSNNEKKENKIDQKKNHNSKKQLKQKQEKKEENGKNIEKNKKKYGPTIIDTSSMFQKKNTNKNKTESQNVKFVDQKHGKQDKQKREKQLQKQSQKIKVTQGLKKQKTNEIDTQKIRNKDKTQRDKTTDKSIKQKHPSAPPHKKQPHQLRDNQFSKQKPSLPQKPIDKQKQLIKPTKQKQSSRSRSRDKPKKNKQQSSSSSSSSSYSSSAKKKAVDEDDDAKAFAMLHDFIGANQRREIYRRRDRLPIYESGTRDIMREDRFTYMVAMEDERRERQREQREIERRKQRIKQRQQRH